jgi:hypothetical protein
MSDLVTKLLTDGYLHVNNPVTNPRGIHCVKKVLCNAVEINIACSILSGEVGNRGWLEMGLCMTRLKPVYSG